MIFCPRTRDVRDGATYESTAFNSMRSESFVFALIVFSMLDEGREKERTLSSLPSGDRIQVEKRNECAEREGKRMSP